MAPLCSISTHQLFIYYFFGVLFYFLHGVLVTPRGHLAPYIHGILSCLRGGVNDIKLSITRGWAMTYGGTSEEPFVAWTFFFIFHLFRIRLAHTGLFKDYKSMLNTRASWDA